MVEQHKDPLIIEHTDDLRRTPIFFAAACPSPAPLQYLIQKGARLETKAMYSRDNKEAELSPLLVAVKYNRADNIPYLLGRKPIDDEKGDVTAESQSNSGKEEMERFQEVVNEPLDRKTNKRLIHVAAFYGNAEVLATLLDCGANPKAIMSGTRTSALHLAAQFGHLNACKVLVEHSKAPKNKRALLLKDINKRIPLILAVMNGHLDVVKYMLTMGAPAYTMDSSENSAIHYAAAYGWYVSSEIAHIPSLCPCSLFRNDILKCLMAAPFANPGVFNMWKLSPFFIAMIKGHDLCASTLLETKDFDVNATDSEGKSILHYMMENKNFNPQKTLNQMKRIVLELGADVNGMF